MTRTGEKRTTDRTALLAAERIYGGAGLRSGEVAVGIAYPNTYGVAMSNLGFQTILARARRSGLCSAERLFWEGSPPPLKTFESARPAGGLDLLAFSVSFENDYVHLLRMLAAARIPLFHGEREDRHPIVLVGGASTLLNPEPLRPFADLFLLGEAEESFEEYLRLRLADLGRPRRFHLERAARIEGAYVPSVHGGSGEIARRIYPAVTGDPAAGDIVTPHGAFRDMFLVEISRGCPRRCRFCAVGSGFPRFRAVPAPVVLESVARRRAEDERLGRAPLRRVGLVTSAFFDHPGAEEIACGLSRKGYEIGASSVRVDRLTTPLLEVLRESGLRTLTIAPEAGTEEARRRIGKSAGDGEILAGIERAARAGFERIRVYFMIGLPFESDRDRRGIVRLAEAIRDRFREAAPRPGRITVSLHPFVPKPRTPFRWGAMMRPAELRRIVASLRKELTGFRVRIPPLGEVYTEGILARGGEEVAPFLVRLAGGERWDRAARGAGLDLDAILHRERPADERGPWEGRGPDRARAIHRREWERAAARGGRGT